MVGSAYIIAAIRIGKGHPRRRGFGDTTDGDAKGVGLTEIFAGATGFFAFVFVVVLILTILDRNQPWLLPSWLLPFFIRPWLAVALWAIGFVVVACLILVLTIPGPRIE